MAAKTKSPIFTDADLGVMLTALEVFRDSAKHLALCPNCSRLLTREGQEQAKCDYIEAQAAIDALLIAVQEGTI